MKSARDEYDVMKRAGARLALDVAGAQLVNASSRLIWHLPNERLALLVSRPATKTLAAISSETAAIHAAVSAGVRTPRVVAGPISLPQQRHAMAIEWVSGRSPVTSDWSAIVNEAARLGNAAENTAIPLLQWQPDLPDDRIERVLGDQLAAAFTRRCVAAAAEIDSLTASVDLALSHGDLHPGNAIVDGDSRAWLVDLEYACRGPREWDPAKLIILSRRFGDPTTISELLPAWGPLDQDRIARCVSAQEVLLVSWLARMASDGVAGAGAEARYRAKTLADRNCRWHHLHWSR